MIRRRKQLLGRSFASDADANAPSGPSTKVIGHVGCEPRPRRRSGTGDRPGQPRWAAGRGRGGQQRCSASMLARVWAGGRVTQTASAGRAPRNAGKGCAARPSPRGNNVLFQRSPRDRRCFRLACVLMTIIAPPALRSLSRPEPVTRGGRTPRASPNRSPVAHLRPEAPRRVFAHQKGGCVVPSAFGWSRRDPIASRPSTGVSPSVMVCERGTIPCLGRWQQPIRPMMPPLRGRGAWRGGGGGHGPETAACHPMGWPGQRPP